MTAAGGSLEDCHTNVFVLTELNGLKWKCLTTVQNFGQQANELIEEDPVLCAYGECVSQSLLCTWRRRPRTNNNSADSIFDDPTPMIDSQKELWIFWYSQDEPKCIESFRSNGLVVADEYESFDVGVNYETRVLFFKALHNVIERNLLRNGYIRFGKWFARPLDMPIVDFERALPQYINAINFRFFMHGENHVCVTINVQRQPTMLRLSSCHFETSKCQPVILGPWSIRAVLLPNQPLKNCAEKYSTNDKNLQKPFEYFSMFSGIDAKSKQSREANGFAEIQAAITKQWNDWKKFQALPLDEDEEVVGSDASETCAGTSALPKMVLVEVDGLRMFYPSCYVGVLADQMVFDKKNCRTASSADKASTNVNSNCQNSAVHSTTELDLSFGEHFGSRLNKGGSSISGFCAEDHEVEKILNSHISSESSVLRISPSLRKGSSFAYGSAQNSLRHCKRSFAGIRAARRSFENGSLSVLLSTNCISRRLDILGADSMMMASGSTNFINGSAQVEEDTRWNFFDYLRREYCYCKMCSNNNPSTSTAPDNAGTHLLNDINKDAHAFHRSPTVLESVTPDHSPTFDDELRALRVMTSTECDGLSSTSSSTSDTDAHCSMWTTGVSTRPDLISGRLEFGNSSNMDDADILKILPLNRHFSFSSANSHLVRPITPFTPITSITPEPEGASNGETNEFIGLNKKYDSSLQHKLKDFNYLCNPLKRDLVTTKSYHILGNRKKPKPIGPTSENIFLTHLASNRAFINNVEKNSNNLPLKQPSSILKSLLDDGPTSPLVLKNESVIEMPNGGNFSNSFDCFSNFKINGKTSLSKLTADSRKRAKMRKLKISKSVFEAKSSLQFPTIKNFDVHHNALKLGMFNDSTDGNCPPSSSSLSSHMISSVPSNHMHILSPPASNERVEFLTNGLANASTTMVIGGNLPTLQPQTLFSALSGAEPMVNDSLSFIYPTPPTPMQQFSPPNVALNVMQYSFADHHYQLQYNSNEPLLLPSVVGSPPFLDPLSQTKSVVGHLFDDSKKLDFPDSESFSVNLLDNSVDINQKLQATSMPSVSLGYCTLSYAASTGKTKNKEQLKSALEARSVRLPINLPPTYKKASPEKLLCLSKTAIDTDRQLVMSLEKTEMALCMAVHGRQNFMGPAMFPINHNFMPYNLINYGQHSMMGNVEISPQMNQFGGMHPSRFPTPMGNNPILPVRPGVMPPNFRLGVGGSINFQQQQHQQFLQQQQMLNNQMVGAGMQKSGLSPQQSPNYSNHNMQMQMFQQQFGNKRSQQSPLMDQTNSAGIFGKSVMPGGNQPPGMLSLQQSGNQFSIGTPTGGNVFQPPLPQAQQMLNRFGNSPQMVNLPQNPSNANASATTLSRNNSMIGSDGGYSLPFGSPTGSVKHPQRTASNNSSTSLGMSLANGASTNGASLSIDFLLPPSSVNSTSSAVKNCSNLPIVQKSATLNWENIVKATEGYHSYVIAVLLQDTVLDLHFDSVFDACPICCCNANIRTNELGFYLKASDDVARCDDIQKKQQQKSRFMPDHWSGFCVSAAEIQSKCNCGFSAVRHRYLCGGFSGLFLDDCIEACGKQPLAKKADQTINRLIWFNPALTSDLQLLDLLRHQSLTRDFCSLIRSSYYLGNFADPLNKCEKIGFDITDPTDYIVSCVDSVEVNKIMSSVISAVVSTKNSAATEVFRPSELHQRPVYHSWGVQIANGVREPKDSEYIAVIREIQPILDDSMREARGLRSQTFANTKKLEGPLTWRSFLLKTSKAHTQQQEDEICQVEPIPNVIVATEREPVATSPQLVNMWEKLSLAPYDQTKDVLYLAVVPDSNVVVEKCQIFLEELSSVYDKCRFGWHVRAHARDSPRNGIIRLNHRSIGNPNNTTLNFLSNFDNIDVNDRKVMMSRLKGFAENMENELLQFFKTNDSVFERRAFHDSVYRNSIHQNYTSLATSSDTSSMPPPAIPIQSPNSVLSSASGPSSANAALNLSGLMQMAQSISPSQNSQQQTSPVTGPNSAPSASNISGSGGPVLEELTPEGHFVGQSNLQQQLQQPQNQASMEAEIEKNVEEMLSVENPCYLPHIIVIYVINPFSFGGDAHHPVFARLATVAILKAYNSFLYQLSLKRRSQFQLEIVNLQSLYDYTSFVADPLREDRQNIELVENSNRDKMSAHDCLRKIAFTVYSQPRLLLPEHTRSSMTKSMTRFGPASAFSDILDLINQKTVAKLFKVSSSPFILAPTKSIGVFTSKDGAVINPTNSAVSNSKLQVVSAEDRVLFVTYCLIGNEWLCAAVTDEQGHLLDNVLINLVAVQPATSGPLENSTWKYANHSQIFDSIQRLWQYIQSVLLMDSRNWRLVIGRVGKIGHGEFKAWTETLSKRNLRAYNNSLKSSVKQENQGVNSCKSCTLIPGYQEMPAILSACLVSTEPELHLRIFPSSVQSEGNSNLFTASVSASGAASNVFLSNSKNTKSKSPQGPSVAAALAVADDPSITHIMVFPTILNISFEQQLGQSNQDDNDFDNYFCTDHKMEEDEQLHTLMNSMIGDDFDLNTDLTKTDEDTTIDNQPMATGYYISTAPALDLPDWFWSTCPSARRRSPVHLKNSLHIHTGNIQQSDEIAAISNKSGGGGVIDAHHPLDSTATDEVLKYVLEKYNALSWMNVDFATGARQSCLPVHVQALLRLQKSLTTLFS